MGTLRHSVVLGQHTQVLRNLYNTVMLGQVYPYRFYKWIQSFVENCMGNSTTQRGQEGAVVRAVASHQCGLG